MPPDSGGGPRRRSEDSSEAAEAEARVSSREALRFLTRAGRVLSRSLDPDQTLKRLVRLAVPRVACFAMIDLLRDDDRLDRVAFGHIDPSKESLLARPEPFRPTELGILPLAQVIESGKPLLVEDVERDWTGSAEILERVRLLAGRSLIIVPLEIHGEMFGTLTFGSTRTDRHYGRSDVTLAQELARTAALALENSRLYRQAQHAITARDEVLAVVSHDLRNPVSRVRLAAELLLDTNQIAESGRNTAHIIIRAADEMQRLIGDLVEAARAEAGNLTMRTSPLSVDRLLEHLDESHAATARAKNLAWRVDRPPRPLTIEGDEGRLLQALGNFVGNAMKFTPEGGEVHVVIEEANRTVRIGVVDTGPGMDEEQLTRVFERFWQAETGDHRGAGLGLAIARGIVEAHSGRVWLESEVGEGTKAWLEVPLAG
ncbi:MAG: GAF domain-containing sensor histidine kinase [Gemmatimonadota bacterium]